MSLSGKAAIVGIGATEFSKESGRSELQLAVEAVGHALRDCGIAPSEVDGLTTFTMDNNSEIAVARELGMGERHGLTECGLAVEGHRILDHGGDATEDHDGTEREQRDDHGTLD